MSDDVTLGEMLVMEDQDWEAGEALLSRALLAVCDRMCSLIECVLL
jgi:hypothetical protein